MKKYKSYKPSGLSWIDVIPCNWNSCRIKNLFSLRDERNYKPLDEVNLISLYSKVGVLQNSDIEKTTGNRAANADGYKCVYEDDIIVNIILCWMGAIGRSAYNGVTSPAYDVYIPHEKVSSKYYHYLFRTQKFCDECYKVGKGIMKMRWRVYSPQFMNIRVPVPPYSEQYHIVRYLDWKVSEINKLIAERHNEITTLEELKEKIINDSVAKGLHDQKLIHNDDIRWDIDYPESWSLKRIRELFSFRKGLSITKANLKETGIPVINYGQVHSKKNSMVGLNDDILKYIDAPYLNMNPSALVVKGDFIFADTSEDRAGCGNCAYIDREGEIFAGYHSIIAHHKNKTDNKYFAYLFKSLTWRYQIRKRVNGVKVYSITQQILKDAFVLVPSKEEQQEIVEYLDKICRKMDDLISKTEEKITQLRYLKSAIISDAVIGQIDVRNVKIPDYKYVEEESEEDMYNDSDIENIEEQEG